MVKYRYDLETDPEPGPQVKRLRTWNPEYGTGKQGRYVETWVRVPCVRPGSWSARSMFNMTRQDRRWARRDGVFYTTKGGKRMHRPRRARYRIRHGGCSESHYHWYNGDKYRAWGPLRGDTMAVDADAMRRLHSMKRRKWRRR